MSGCVLGEIFKIKAVLKTSRVLFSADLDEMLVGSSAQRSGL